MAENVNSDTGWLMSGGHRWRWGGLQPVVKLRVTTGIAGGYGLNTACGPQPARIAGLMAVAAANKGACDAAMNAHEATIEGLVVAGTEVAWEDERGRTGSRLKLMGYRPVDDRRYNQGGTVCWQFYELEALEMDGGPNAS